MGFPTFRELMRDMEYKPPSPDKARASAEARNVIAEFTDGVADALNTRSFKDLSYAITYAGSRLAELLPVAHPDATAAARQLNMVRLYASRACGGSLPKGATEESYRRLAFDAIRTLDVMVAIAITSQPESSWVADIPRT